MSRRTLGELRDRTAFKPKPPHYELALAHVPLAEVGLADPVEDRVLDAMRRDEDSFVLIEAPPGGGKSSLLAWAAGRATEKTGTLPVVPIYVPVGHHTAPIDSALVVSGVTEGVGVALAGELKKRDRVRLERALAISISTAGRPTRLRVGLPVPLPHGLSASVAAELGGDLTTMVAAGGWKGGPHAGLEALGGLVRARRGRLVVMIEDTDIWSAGDENMARRAGAFFMTMRSLLGCQDVTLVVAAQTHWGEMPSESRKREKNTAAARLQFRELRERVERVLRIPAPRSHDEARALMEAVLERRIEITLERPVPDGGWRTEVFSQDAIELLSRRCLERGVRQPLADVRDTFDHYAVLPERIERSHLVETMGI